MVDIHLYVGVSGWIGKSEVGNNVNFLTDLATELLRARPSTCRPGTVPSVKCCLDIS